jgi:hypothetical protein
MGVARTAKDKKTTPADIINGAHQLALAPENGDLMTSLLERTVAWSIHLGAKARREMDHDDILHPMHKDLLQNVIFELAACSARRSLMNPFHANMLVLPLSRALNRDPSLWKRVDAYACLRITVHALTTDVEQAPIFDALEQLLGFAQGALARTQKQERQAVVCAAAFGDIWWSMQKAGSYFSTYAIIRDRPTWIADAMKTQLSYEGALLPQLDMGL